MKRGSIIINEFDVGQVHVRLSFGHLDHMPRCAKCGRALCSHTDAEPANSAPNLAKRA